jgi:hypothetical protein
MDETHGWFGLADFVDKCHMKLLRKWCSPYSMGKDHTKVIIMEKEGLVSRSWE